MTDITVNLTQAKKLKEIGFPQNNARFYYFEYWGNALFYDPEKIDETDCAAPTLSEMIDFIVPILPIDSVFSLQPDGNLWHAMIGDNIQEGVNGFGETPIDAVFNLICAVKEQK
jgi:hypothetical protein